MDQARTSKAKSYGVLEMALLYLSCEPTRLPVDNHYLHAHELGASYTISEVQFVVLQRRVVMPGTGPWEMGTIYRYLCLFNTMVL